MRMRSPVFCCFRPSLAAVAVDGSDEFALEKTRCPAYVRERSYSAVVVQSWGLLCLILRAAAGTDSATCNGARGLTLQKRDAVRSLRGTAVCTTHPFSRSGCDRTCQLEKEVPRGAPFKKSLRVRWALFFLRPAAQRDGDELSSSGSGAAASAAAPSSSSAMDHSQSSIASVLGLLVTLNVTLASVDLAYRRGSPSLLGLLHLVHGLLFLAAFSFMALRRLQDAALLALCHGALALASTFALLAMPWSLGAGFWQLRHGSPADGLWELLFVLFLAYTMLPVRTRLVLLLGAVLCTVHTLCALFCAQLLPGQEDRALQVRAEARLLFCVDSRF
ncbi:hypothetical protein HPB48_006749 [Haemaphysalis longicornis]|uniref:Uncharacterized protein n=1 Tax=Haemaphysalis longicornis TaxID=44386 RepID=A0A9J6G4Z6_HAELO|nr:hypothetical protein HPB48_006749 [Haemaphysalis longicornis]